MDMVRIPVADKRRGGMEVAIIAGMCMAYKRLALPVANIMANSGTTAIAKQAASRSRRATAERQGHESHALIV